MYTLVTGSAGFIGSQLAAALLDTGVEVVGVDCLTDYYDPEVKRRNLGPLLDREGFRFVAADLAVDDVQDLVSGSRFVVHLAAQPGVRLSWAHFDTYVSRNILATQRLLEAATTARIDRLVFASSSSVYGNADSYPVREQDELRPFSPYGVTKLASERLCAAYAANFGLSSVSLRYFTVYGPRQRPDMSIHRLIVSALRGEPFPLYGAREYEREFTFVGDVVEATRLAVTADVPPATVLNVAGGETVTIGALIELVEELTGATIAIDEQDSKPGDVARNGGHIERAAELLGWKPATSLRDGISAQVEWHRTEMATTSA